MIPAGLGQHASHASVVISKAVNRSARPAAPLTTLAAARSGSSSKPPARRWQLVALALAGVAGSLTLVPAAGAQPGELVYGFGCVEDAGRYWIGLGLIPRPAFNVVVNPMAVPPLRGSGLAPVAEIAGAVGAGAVAHRCTSIATRLTNLALATGTASPLGILTLTEFLQAGLVAGQPVIAIGQLALPDVLATLPLGSDPHQALGRVTERIRRVASGPAIAEVLLREGLVEFVEVPMD